MDKLAADQRAEMLDSLSDTKLVAVMVENLVAVLDFELVAEKEAIEDAR